MVWSNTAVDKITIPSSVEIGNGQDAVVLWGAAIPEELRNEFITAVIMFYRGDYPTEGANPEYEYYFDGLAITKFPIVKKSLVRGAVRNNKDGTKTVVRMHSMPFAVDSVDPYETDASEAVTTQQKALFELSLTTVGMLGIRTWFANVGGSNNGDVNGWYRLTTINGWYDGDQSGYYHGLMWSMDASGTAHVKGNLKCSTPADETISDLATEIPAGSGLPFTPGWDARYTAFAYSVGGSPRLVSGWMSADGLIGMGGELGLPDADTNVIFDFSYKVEQ